MIPFIIRPPQGTGKAPVPSHTAVQVLATAHVHEDDEYAKKVVSGTDTPNAFVVVLDIDEIFE